MNTSDADPHGPACAPTHVKALRHRNDGLRSSTATPAYGRDWVLARLVEIVERAMAGERVLTRDGTPTEQMKYDGAVANRALELIGKLQGLFVERRAEPTEDERSDDELRNELTRILATLAELGIDLAAHSRARDAGGGAQAAPGAN